MVKELSKSIREYKKASIATPILVSMEVVMECTIPFIIALLVNEIKAGCSLGVILRYGAILIVMAALSLSFGGVGGVHLRDCLLRAGEKSPQGYVLQYSALFV